ncbi:MAG TPA: AAA family ATPase, partial [Candidatus Polarisedimenticolia bacterium]|nr:AAA family ATPase [Candidatus Polarisedimenticolia bacterium]
MDDAPKRSGLEVMETGCVTDVTRPRDTLLRERILGQDTSLAALTCSFSRVLSGLRDPSRPVQTLLLLGPTGVGKTETAKALADYLFGWEGALTRLNCEEYAHGHELSRLLGAPPGYIGHGLEPLLSQARIDGPHEQARKEGTGFAGDPQGAFAKALPPE